MLFRKHIIVCIGFLLLPWLHGTAQTPRIFVNVPNGFYELTGGAGNCTWVPLTNECLSLAFSGTYSMAVYKDTIYYLNGSQLYSFKIGVPGSCRHYGTIGSFTSMTVDPNGILYFASSFLYRYDPYTNQLANLGLMPFSSAGDLIFFNGKLLLAGNPPGIYEINIANPAASTLYMSSNGLSFFGLISFPVPCGNSRFFGLAPISSGGTTMHELDLVNKVVLGNTCTLAGLNVYDGGSTTEGGINAGITITNLQVAQPCPPTLTGSINIQAIREGHTVNYTLNGSITNNSGIFNNLPIGQYAIRMVAGGCTLDTVVSITPGLNPIIGVQQTNPNNCDGNNGSITLTASTGHLPISYTLLNNGQQQPSGVFNNLLPGNYQFRIADAAGCSKDTTVTLTLQPPAFVQSVQLDGVHCGTNTGFIKLNIAGGDTSGVTTSLSGAAFLPQVSYFNLGAGTYNIQARRGAFCFFDTTVSIANIIDPKPQLTTMVQPPACFNNNGSINITAAANGFSFQYQLNGGGFGNSGNFNNLAPGSYLLGIRNQYGCAWDTTITIFNVIDPKPQLTAIVQPQICFANNGSINITAAANGFSFQYQLNNGGFGNSGNFGNLAPGSYLLGIRNQNGCAWDTTVTVRPYTKWPVQHNVTATNPNCDDPYDGSIRVVVTGTEGPYELLLNNRPFANGAAATGLTAGSYTIYIKNKDGCTVDSVKQALAIVLEPRCVNLFMPSAFTPNGDGKNDLFRPSQTFFTSNMRMMVFNRYGQMLYSGTGPGVQWDGKYKGADQQGGTYVYWLSYTDFNGVDKKLKGSFLLLR